MRLLKKFEARGPWIPAFAGKATGILRIRTASQSAQPSGNALHRQPQPLQLALNRSVDHARAEFDYETADQPPVDANIDRYPAADAAAQLLAQHRELRFAQRLRCEHFGGDFAATRGKFGEEGLDHCGDGKEAPIARDPQ